MFGPTRITPADVAADLAALEEHYPHAIRSEAAQRGYLKDFVDVLAGKNAEAFKGAVYAWKTDPKNKRMPTPGQLLALVIEKSPPPPKVEVEKPMPEQPWFPPTEQDLARMPLREARRQHLILMGFYLGKAGPMWSGTGPLDVEAMDPARRDRFERNRAKAEHHRVAAQNIAMQIAENRNKFG